MEKENLGMAGEPDTLKGVSPVWRGLTETYFGNKKRRWVPTLPSDNR